MVELSSAARYVTSILPSDMDHPVPVTSRYVPSLQELGGDSFDHRWIDDDHLIVYLVDVSGHGVEPAMVSVSVHNPAALGHPRPRRPAAPRPGADRTQPALPDGSAGRQLLHHLVPGPPTSTRTLRYAGAGHPPAIVLTPDGADPSAAAQRLGAGRGARGDHVRDPQRCPAPVADVLLYSDGAFDLFLPDGRPWTLDEFIDPVHAPPRRRNGPWIASSTNYASGPESGAVHR